MGRLTPHELPEAMPLLHIQVLATGRAPQGPLHPLLPQCADILMLPEEPSGIFQEAPGLSVFFLGP